MGFELSEQGSGAQTKVWLFKCQGGLRTTVQAVKCVSEHEVTAAASGHAHGVSVSQQNTERVKHSDTMCGIFILATHGAMQIKQENECLSHVCEQENVATAVLGHCRTNFEAQGSRIPPVVSLKHKQNCVYTHTAAHSKRDVAHMCRWPLFLWVTGLW